MSNRRLLIGLVLTLGVVSFVAMRAQPKGAKKPGLTALDYAEIQQLNSHYAHALDTCADRGNEFADLFAPGGFYDNGKGHEAEGNKSLAAMAGGPDCAPPKGPLHIGHIIVNTMIEPSPEGAIGKSYLLQVSIGENGTGPGQLLGGSKFYDVYNKTPGGWRFKSRSHVTAPHVDLIPASELSHHPLAR